MQEKGPNWSLSSPPQSCLPHSIWHWHNSLADGIYLIQVSIKILAHLFRFFFPSRIYNFTKLREM